MIEMRRLATVDSCPTVEIDAGDKDPRQARARTGNQREIDFARRIRWGLGAFLVFLAAAAWLSPRIPRHHGLAGHPGADPRFCGHLRERAGLRCVHRVVDQSRGTRTRIVGLFPGGAPVGTPPSRIARHEERSGRGGPVARTMGSSGGLPYRLVPGISLDGISYAAGLTSISFGGFLLATTLGVIPETLLFAYLGHAVHEHAPVVMGISFAIGLCGLVVAVLLGRSRRNAPD